ncbi:MAG: hypothetical protein ACK5BQ_03290 [Ignavibacteria bacterium]|jgi:hypothetical protein
MKPNAPYSPSTLEDHAEISSRQGADVAEQFLMSDALLRDHLRSAEQAPIDPIFTVEIMQSINAVAPSPSWFEKLSRTTRIVGATVMVFSLGFFVGYLATSSIITSEILRFQWIETISTPSAAWILVGASIIGFGIYQMETT